MIVVSGRAGICDGYIRRTPPVEAVVLVSRVLGEKYCRMDQFLMRVLADGHGMIAPVGRANLRWEHSRCTLAIASGCAHSSLCYGDGRNQGGLTLHAGSYFG